MKQHKKYWIIFDPINKLFWESNRLWGYGPSNIAIYEAYFVNKLLDANLMTKKKANEVLDNFCRNHYLIGGTKLKVDLNALEIKEVILEAELRLRPKYFP